MDVNMSDVQPLFTPETLARRLNVSPRTVRKWDLARRIPGRLKLGRCVRFDATTIEKAIARGDLLQEARR